MTAGYSGAEICSTVFGSEYCLLYNDPGLNYAESHKHRHAHTYTTRACLCVCLCERAHTALCERTCLCTVSMCVYVNVHACV